MAKIKTTNDEGEEIEIDALTPEEQQKLEEEYKNKLAEKDTTFANLDKEKKELEAKISKMEVEGIKDDHPNFKILKEALGKKDEDIKSLRESIDSDKKTRIKESFDNSVKLAVKGNEELEKKVRLHLEKTLSGLPEDTAQQRQEKLEHALKLASDGSSDGPGMFDGGTGGGGYSGGFSGGVNTVEFTAREKALGAKLGITEEDYKKYGSRLTNK